MDTINIYDAHTTACFERTPELRFQRNEIVAELCRNSDEYNARIQMAANRKMFESFGAAVEGIIDIRVATDYGGKDYLGSLVVRPQVYKELKILHAALPLFGLDRLAS